MLTQTGNALFAGDRLPIWNAKSSISTSSNHHHHHHHRHWQCLQVYISQIVSSVNVWYRRHKFSIISQPFRRVDDVFHSLVPLAECIYFILSIVFSFCTILCNRKWRIWAASWFVEYITDYTKPDRFVAAGSPPVCCHSNFEQFFGREILVAIFLFCLSVRRSKHSRIECLLLRTQ